MSAPETALRWRHRARVAEAIVLLVAARALVAGVSFRHWRGWFGEVAATPGQDRLDEAAALRARRVGRAVSQAARHLPLHCKCLPQAMAASWMLRRRAIPSEIVFGVLDSGRRGTPDDLHAWARCGGYTIAGEGEPIHNPVLVLTRMVKK